MLIEPKIEGVACDDGVPKLRPPPPPLPVPPKNEVAVEVAVVVAAAAEANINVADAVDGVPNNG